MELGPLYGALAIVDRLREIMPSIPRPKIDSYKITPFTTVVKPDGSILDEGTMLLLAPPPEQYFRVERNCGWTTNVSVRHDGAANMFTYAKGAQIFPPYSFIRIASDLICIEFIAEYFRKAVFVNWWPLKAFVKETFPLDLIRVEHPDVSSISVLKGEFWVQSIRSPRAQ